MACGKDIANPAAVIARLDKARAKYAGHGAGAWRRIRRRAHRGKLGRAQRRPPDRLQARLAEARTRRSLAPQRRTAQPPAPRASSPSPAPASPTTSSTRQGSSASRSSAAPPDRSASTGRVAHPARPVLPSRHDPRCGGADSTAPPPALPAALPQCSCRRFVPLATAFAWLAAPALRSSPVTASPCTGIRTPVRSHAGSRADRAVAASGSVLRTTARGSAHATDVHDRD